MSLPPPIPLIPQADCFTTGTGTKTRALLALAGAAGLVLVAVAGFVLCLRTKADMMMLQMMTTLPMLGAIGLFISAIKSLRSPRMVRLAEEGLEVTNQRGVCQRWDWERIAFAKTEGMPLNSKQQLILYGAKGKPLVKLGPDFLDFAAMEQAIQRRLARQASSYRADAQRSKARRSGVFLMVGGLLAWALMGANAWTALADREAQRLLKEQGVCVSAKVVEKAIAPDGRTHRLHYEVRDANGKSDTANVEVDPVLWQVLQVGMTVQVMAVPGRPEISHMVAGQIDDAAMESPQMRLLLSAVIGFMGAFFFGAGFLSWRGIELSLEGGLHIRRVGEASEKLRT